MPRASGSTRCGRSSKAWGSSTRSTRAWCGAWTTTPRPSSSCARAAGTWAPRTRCAGVDATIAWCARWAGLRTEIEHRDAGLKQQLKRADKLKARLALLIGEDEIKSGQLALKDLATGQQHAITLDQLESRIHQLLD